MSGLFTDNISYNIDTAMLYKITDLNIAELSDPTDRQWLYYERYGNGGTRNYSAISQRTEIEERYQPGNPAGEPYEVPGFLLDNSDGGISVYHNNASRELLELVQKGNRIWMNVFPQFSDNDRQDIYLKTLKSSALERRNIKVIPTSSCRTVFDVASKAMFKLHCPYMISRFDRRLGQGTIRHCITVTKELHDLLETGRYSKFAILSDSIGVSFNGSDGWGYIVRESTHFLLLPINRKEH